MNKKLDVDYTANKLIEKVIYLKIVLQEMLSMIGDVEYQLKDEIYSRGNYVKKKNKSKN